MHPALVRCETCPHPRATHAPTEDALCRVNGCECPGYTVTMAEREPEPEPTGGGHPLLVVIPDGYAATVTLTPLDVVEGGAP